MSVLAHRLKYSGQADTAMYKENSRSHYGNFNEPQKRRIKELEPKILSALACIPVDMTKPFTICDYGCADGTASMALMEKCINSLRQQHGDGLSIDVIYNDLPLNDFESTLQNVKGIESKFKNVCIRTKEKSFYDQVNPEVSVNLALCFASIHWISRGPTNLGKEIMHLLSGPEHHKSWQEQAAVDWQKFLINRRKELLPGGRLIINDVFGSGQNGECPSIAHHIRLTQLWKEMHQDQIITELELDHTVMMQYARTEEEFRKPFTDPSSPLYQEDLNLLCMKTSITPCFYLELLKTGPGTEEMRRNVSYKYAMYIRQWADHAFTDALASRSEKDRKRIVDELFSRFEEALFEGIEDYFTGTIQTYLEISKGK